MNLDLDKLEAAAKAASPGPWRGDRIDGTVKYSLIAADDTNVINGDNGNSDHGPYGIMEERDELYLLTAHPAAVLELIRRLRDAEADVARLDHMAESHSYIDCAQKGNGEALYWLVFPNTGDVQVGAYESPREAIDADMPAQGASHD